VSKSTIFVEMEPGLSYTAALYFFGISTEAMIAVFSFFQLVGFSRRYSKVRYLKVSQK
jgi:hypothetical protein